MPPASTCAERARWVPLHSSAKPKPASALALGAEAKPKRSHAVRGTLPPPGGVVSTSAGAAPGDWKTRPAPIGSGTRGASWPVTWIWWLPGAGTGIAPTSPGAPGAKSAVTSAPSRVTVTAPGSADAESVICTGSWPPAVGSPMRIGPVAQGPAPSAAKTSSSGARRRRRLGMGRGLPVWCEAPILGRRGGPGKDLPAVQASRQPAEPGRKRPADRLRRVLGREMEAGHGHLLLVRGQVRQKSRSAPTRKLPGSTFTNSFGMSQPASHAA